MRSTEERVASVLTEWCKVPAEEIGEDRLLKELDLDSMILIEVQLALQKEFGFTLNDDDFMKIQTVRDLTRLVEASLPSLPAARAAG